MKGIRKPGNETARRESENSQRGIAGRATTPVGAAPSACKGLPALPHSRSGRVRFRYLLVRDRRAGWARKMDNFEAVEADFAAPFLEIGGRIIERVAEFDQHV